MKGQFLPYKDENPTEHWPVVTASLLFISTAVFLWSLFDFEAIVTTWGFIPAVFIPATLFTSIFLHGSVAHILSNMLFLYIYGDNVEDKFGRLMFMAFYLSAGVFAGFVHFLSDPSSIIPTIGASGAISGVLGAYLAMFPRVKIRTIGPFYMMYRIRASVLIGLWFVLQLVLGAFSLVGYGSSIAFFAHIGGFLFGYMAARIYCSGKPKTQPKPAIGFFPKKRQ